MKLGKAIFVVPTLFTLSSVFLGLLSIVNTIGGNYPMAATAILFAILFDMLDGKVARLTRTQSAFGIQIDSLADVISFGVAPAVLVYEACLKQISYKGLDLGLVIAFIFLAAGAIRLARYNVLAEIQEGPVRRFVGLPIPTAAGTLASLVLGLSRSGVALDPALFAGMTLVVTLLMVSTISYRKSLSASTRKRTFLLLAPYGAYLVLVALLLPNYFFFGLMFYYVTFGLFDTLALRLTDRRRERDAKLNGDDDS
jgi:CDP-diacylglycerol---serine O-phosphatidyltransferase